MKQSNKKELTDRLKSVSSFYESWNQCCQNVAIRNLDKTPTRITTGLFGLFKSFPLDGSGRLTRDIIDDTVDVSHFIHNAVRDFRKHIIRNA